MPKFEDDNDKTKKLGQLLGLGNKFRLYPINGTYFKYGALGEAVLAARTFLKTKVFIWIAQRTVLGNTVAFNTVSKKLMQHLISQCVCLKYDHDAYECAQLQKKLNVKIEKFPIVIVVNTESPPKIMFQYRDFDNVEETIIKITKDLQLDRNVSLGQVFTHQNVFPPPQVNQNEQNSTETREGVEVFPETEDEKMYDKLYGDDDSEPESDEDMPKLMPDERGVKNPESQKSENVKNEETEILSPELYEDNNVDSDAVLTLEDEELDIVLETREELSERIKRMKRQIKARKEENEKMRKDEEERNKEFKKKYQENEGTEKEEKVKKKVDDGGYKKIMKEKRRRLRELKKQIKGDQKQNRKKFAKSSPEKHQENEGTKKEGKAKVKKVKKKVEKVKKKVDDGGYKKMMKEKRRRLRELKKQIKEDQEQKREKFAKFSPKSKNKSPVEIQTSVSVTGNKVTIQKKSKSTKKRRSKKGKEEEEDEVSVEVTHTMICFKICGEEKLTKEFAVTQKFSDVLAFIDQEIDDHKCFDIVIPFFMFRMDERIYEKTLRELELYPNSVMHLNRISSPASFSFSPYDWYYTGKDFVGSFIGGCLGLFKGKQKKKKKQELRERKVKTL